MKRIQSARLPAFLVTLLAFGIVPVLSVPAQEPDTSGAAKAAPTSPTSETFLPPAAAPAPVPAPDRSSVIPLPPISKAGSGACQDLYEQVRNAHDSMPADVGLLSREKADELAATVQAMLETCDRFEKECASADRTQVGEVSYVQAKGLFLLSERYRLDTLNKLRTEGVPDISAAGQQAMKSYFARVQQLAQRAFDSLSADNALRPRALQISGQASAEADDHEAALKAYQAIIDLYPKDPEIDKVLTALGRAHLDLGNYDLGIAVAERVQKDYYESDSYSTAGELLWKLYHSKGDLAGMQQVVKTVETVYPLRLSSARLTQAQRDRLRLFLDFNGFRKGYVLLALGDFVGAAQAFKAHIADIDSRPDSSSPSKVYQQRSRDNLAFVEALAGKPAPGPLDLLWVTEKKPGFADLRGKAVALVFRGVDDARSAGFLGPLWSYVQSHPGTAMVVVSYLRGGENVDKQTAAMTEELAKVGYTGPAGFDPDSKGKQLFRSFQANVGSATFYVVDPEGNLTWFMQDPRSVDEQFATALLERTAVPSRRFPLPTVVVGVVVLAAALGLLVVFFARGGKSVAR